MNGSSFVRPEPAPVLGPRAPVRPPRRSWRTWLFGHPLSTADAPHEAIGKTVGLAVFASDALSSTAYATQEILLVLALAGSAAFAYAVPISIAIVVLLAIVAVSYEQTIHAYPDGGGAYIVARDNLGELPAQVAGAALLMDYVLTVAVSVSSGVAQITSAFPSLFEHRVALAVALVGAVMLINLRGTKESGTVFAVPTYFFLAAMALTVGLGFARLWGGTLGAVPHPPELEVTRQLEGVTLFLLLHAFSNGTTALTGVEAISNGITAFKEPRSRNAAVTLVWMAVILGTLFLGMTYLAHAVAAVPSERETIVSQLARTVLGGRGPAYLAVIAATTLILVMAANTAYAGFPRLAALQAADGLLPRQLNFRGSRLVYSRGIALLALAASLLIVIFQASVTGLIPLYAIGVFLSFTLSQAGMTRRWWLLQRQPARGAELDVASDMAPEVQERRVRGPGGQEPPAQERSRIHSGAADARGPNSLRATRIKMLANGFGTACTAVVAVVFVVTKFHEGAWVVVLIIPLLVAAFRAVRRHYAALAQELSLEDFGAPPRIARHRVIVPISGVHRGTVTALRYARALSHDITAVYVSTDPARTEALRSKWGLWGSGLRLVVLESPYRLLLEPLLDYIRSVVARRQANEVVTIVVPQFVPRRNWHNLLHAQTAVLLRLALLFERGIVITNVPYQVGKEED